MSLIDDVKVSLRVTSSAFDTEVQMLIDAAIADMGRVGVDEALLSTTTPGDLVNVAIHCYAKANFGYDNPEAGRFNEMYRQTVCDLINSPAVMGSDE